MKKYLMTGMAALAICAAFTSCSKETNVYNPDQPKQDIQLTYEQAFIKAIGQPAANQDWGFGTAAKTRATTYMNGNMEKYYDAPTRGATEEADVEAYVHALKVLPAKAAPDWDTYFVTQIHEGTASYNTQKTVDYSTEYVAGNQMDELSFAMVEGAIIKDDGTLQGDWIHINNFNSANNTDWNGNTLVEDGGTVDFAYKSSADSKYHNRWIGIDGKNVPNSQGQLGDYDDYYYICFDFESTADAYTPIFWRENGNAMDGYCVLGACNSLEEAQGKTIYRRVWNSTLNKTEVEEYSVFDTNREGTSEWRVDNVVGGNMVVVGNNDYTDWIVRLYKAKEKNVEEPNYTIGVIGEDLTSAEEGDFDFNDVVFNVALNVPGKTYIKLRAAGGTLPLIIGIADPKDNEDYTANEVHNLFGGYSTKTMINTGASAYGASADGVPEKEFVLNQEYSNAKFIPVYVKKNGQWVELTAAQGVPASKIGVSPDFRIVPEQVFIGSEGQYPLFTDWVTKNTHDVSNWQGVVSGN